MINSAKESCRQQNLPDRANAKQMFRDLDFDDLFEDAGMVDLVVYLRGNRHLKIPEELRPYLPTQLEKHTFKRPLKNIQKTLKGLLTAFQRTFDAFLIAYKLGPFKRHV